MQSVSVATAGIVIPVRWLPGTLAATPALQPLEQFDYGDVVLASDLHEKQLEETHSMLMGLSDDSLLKPFRQMSGQPAPGEDLGGWYHYNPDYKLGKDRSVDFGKRPPRANAGNARKFCSNSSSMEHGRPCRTEFTHDDAPRTNRPAASADCRTVIRTAGPICDHGFATINNPRGLAGCQENGPANLASKNGGAPIKMLPFTDISEEQYLTYLSIA